MLYRKSVYKKTYTFFLLQTYANQRNGLKDHLQPKETQASVSNVANSIIMWIENQTGAILILWRGKKEKFHIISCLCPAYSSETSLNQHEDMTLFSSYLLNSNLDLT